MSEKPQSRGDKPMTVGEHLEELRRRLIYALIGLAAGTAAAMFFTKRLIRALKSLVDKDLVDKADGQYEIIDLFFKRWIKTSMSNQRQ